MWSKSAGRNGGEGRVRFKPYFDGGIKQKYGTLSWKNDETKSSHDVGEEQTRKF